MTMGRKRQSNKDLPRRMYLKDRVYYFVDAGNNWHPLGKIKVDAFVEYARLNSRDAGEIVTMADVMDRFVKEEISKLATRTRKDRIAELKNLRPVFGSMHPDDITPRHIYKYMDLRKAPVRANRERSFLSTLFMWSIRWGAGTQNPCRDVKPYPEKPRDRLVTDKEFWAVYEIAPPVIQLAMMLAWVTGARQRTSLI